MILYEIVTIITAVIASAMLGALYATKHELHLAKVDLKDATNQSKDSVDRFEDITKKASEANLSMGNMLADLEQKLVVMDERISMLQGSAPMGGIGQTWQPTAPKTQRK